MRTTHQQPTWRRFLLLVLIVGLLGVASAACGDTGAAAEPSLAELAQDQEGWHGRLVQVEGTLRTFDDPRHYWIEDANQNRVELVPHDGLADLVGQTLLVEGRFTFREGEGRRITMDMLEVVDRSSSRGLRGAPALDQFPRRIAACRTEGPPWIACTAV